MKLPALLNVPSSPAIAYFGGEQPKENDGIQMEADCVCGYSYRAGRCVLRRHCPPGHTTWCISGGRHSPCDCICLEDIVNL